MRVTGYVVLKPTYNKWNGNLEDVRVVRATQKKPQASDGAIAIKLDFDVPAHVFEPLNALITVNMPEPVEIPVEVSNERVHVPGEQHPGGDQQDPEDDQA